LGTWSGCLTDTYQERYFEHVPPGEGPGEGRPRTILRNYISQLALLITLCGSGKEGLGISAETVAPVTQSQPSSRK